MTRFHSELRHLEVVHILTDVSNVFFPAQFYSILDMSEGLIFLHVDDLGGLCFYPYIIHLLQFGIIYFDFYV